MTTSLDEKSETEEKVVMHIHSKAIFLLLTWYFFSALTLFLNKEVVFFANMNATVLGSIQMLMTVLGGAFQMYMPLGMFEKVHRSETPPGFYKHMIVVGSLRFFTVILGLVALEFVEVSFTETVKSSAPVITVIISQIFLGEITGFYVKLSLIPVMAGLALCSANELSFHFIGFAAALGTNLSECMQNVYSKKLISGGRFKYSPAELQFFTGLASFTAQIPLLFYLIDLNTLQSLDRHFLTYCFLNGLFFHFQTISNFALLEYISPVSHSVANTAKRALLIIASVLYFGNTVSFLSAMGTIIVLAGVVLYNKALLIDKQQMKNHILKY